MVHYRILNRAEFGAALFHEKKTLEASPSCPLPFPSPPSPPQEPNRGWPESLAPRYNTINSRRARTLSFHIPRRERRKQFGKSTLFGDEEASFCLLSHGCPGNRSCFTSWPCGAVTIRGYRLKKKKSFALFYLCAQNSLISGSEHFRLWVLWKQENKRKNQNDKQGDLYLFLTFYFLLGYSWLTMLWWFQVNSKGTQPYIYVYPFCLKLPSQRDPLPVFSPSSPFWNNALNALAGSFSYL